MNSLERTSLCDDRRATSLQADILEETLCINKLYVNKTIFMIQPSLPPLSIKLYPGGTKIKEVDVYNITIKGKFAPLLFGCNWY